MLRKEIMRRGLDGGHRKLGGGMMSEAGGGCQKLGGEDT